jgi:hypothetical protein
MNCSRYLHCWSKPNKYEEIPQSIQSRISKSVNNININIIWNINMFKTQSSLMNLKSMKYVFLPALIGKLVQFLHNSSADRMWPAGHSLETPAVGHHLNLQRKCQFWTCRKHWLQRSASL